MITYERKSPQRPTCMHAAAPLSKSWLFCFFKCNVCCIKFVPHRHRVCSSLHIAPVVFMVQVMASLLAQYRLRSRRYYAQNGSKAFSTHTILRIIATTILLPKCQKRRLYQHFGKNTQNGTIAKMLVTKTLLAFWQQYQNGTIAKMLVTKTLLAFSQEYGRTLSDLMFRQTD